MTRASHGAATKGGQAPDPSGLRFWAEGVMESALLAMLIVVPLLFVADSSRVFEAPKIAVVRTLAILMGAAWLIRGLATGGARNGAGPAAELGPPSPTLKFGPTNGEWWRVNPLAAPVLLVLLANVISTLASISPELSLIGGHERMQGVVTILSYVVIFFVATSIMRSSARLERALTIVLVTSFPVAMYGVLQWFALDPIEWNSLGSTVQRSASTMGNSIFLGAYLLMVIPVTLGRIIASAGSVTRPVECRRKRAPLYGGVISSWLILTLAWVLSFDVSAREVLAQELAGIPTPSILSAAQTSLHYALGVNLAVIAIWWAAGKWTRRSVPFLLIGLYTFLLALQTACFVFAQSRGPFVGLVVGVFTFVLLYALARGIRRLALGASGLAAGCLIGLLVLALYDPIPLVDAPYLGRLTRVVDTEVVSSRVRVLIWQGALDVAGPHAPLWSPTTGEDSLNALRPLIGYGPDSLFVASNQMYPPALGPLAGHTARPDRAHNATLDAWTQTGLVGLVSYLALWIAAFSVGVKGLGLIPTDRQHRLFLGCCLGSTAVVSLLVGLAFGWHFIGVAVSAGVVLGLFLYLTGATLVFWSAQPERPSPAPPRAMLLIMLVSALVGHFIEIQFGFGTATTQTYFWLFLAGLVGVAVGHASGIERPGTNAGLGSPLTRDTASTDYSGVVRQPSVTGPRPRPDPTIDPLIAFAVASGLMLATLSFDFVSVGSVVGAAGESARTHELILGALTSKVTTEGLRPSMAVLWLFVGTLLTALAVPVAEWGRDAVLRTRDWVKAVGLFGAVACTIWFSFVAPHALLVQIGRLGSLEARVSTFSVFVLFVIVLVLVVGGILSSRHLPSAASSSLLARAAVPVVTLFAGFLTLWANVNTVQADVIHKQAPALAPDSGSMVGLFRRALEIQPLQNHSLILLGDAYLLHGMSVAEAGTVDEPFTRAAETFSRARETNPFSPEPTARLAQLHHAWAGLSTLPAEKEAQFRQALNHHAEALRLDPAAVQLYGRFAQTLLDYAEFLASQQEPARAAQARQEAAALLDQALDLDSSFCLTYATRAATHVGWREKMGDVLIAFAYLSRCDTRHAPLGNEARQIALRVLAAALEEAFAAGESPALVSLLEGQAYRSPTPELYMALAEAYARTGSIDSAVAAAEAAVALLPVRDQQRRHDYQDAVNALRAKDDRNGD